MSLRLGDSVVVREIIASTDDQLAEFRAGRGQRWNRHTDVPGVVRAFAPNHVEVELPGFPFFDNRGRTTLRVKVGYDSFRSAS